MLLRGLSAGLRFVPRRSLLHSAPLRTLSADAMADVKASLLNGVYTDAIPGLQAAREKVSVDAVSDVVAELRARGRTDGVVGVLEAAKLAGVRPLSPLFADALADAGSVVGDCRAVLGVTMGFPHVMMHMKVMRRMVDTLLAAFPDTAVLGPVLEELVPLHTPPPAGLPPVVDIAQLFLWVFSQAGNLEDGWRARAAMQRLGVVPLAGTAEYWLSALRHKVDPVVTLDEFDSLVAEGLTPDVYVLATVLSLCRRSGDLPRARQYWKAHACRDTYAFNAMLACFEAASVAPADVLPLVDELRASDVRPDAVTRKLVHALLGNPAGTADAAANAIAAGNPTLGLYLLRMAAGTRRQRSPVAPKAFEACLQQFCERGDGDAVLEAVKLAKRMRARIRPPLFATALGAVLPDVTVAKELMRAVLGSPHVVNDWPTRGLFISVLSEVEDPASLLPLVDLIDGAYHPTSTATLADILLQTFCKTGDLDAAWAVRAAMRRLSLWPTSSGATHWMSALKAVDQDRTALEEYDSMLKEGLRPDSYTLTTVLSVCRREGDYDRAKSYWAAYSGEPDAHNYTSMIHCAVEAEDLDGALALLHRMLASNLTVPPLVFASLSKTCVDKGFHTAAALLRGLQLRNMK